MYRGVDTQTGERVAIKVPATRYPGQSVIDDFRNEARANRRLHHPLVLEISDFFVADRVPVLVSPLGRATLADRLERRLPLSRILRYADDMLAALAHAHQHHVLHCDVKPGNLIVLPSGRLTLADFGTARRGHRTVMGDCSGTRGYMAPEQELGRPSARSDVYSAGMVLREMLLGDSAAPRRHRLPPDLRAIIERATDPDPQKRYADARDMLKALRAVERRLEARRAQRRRRRARRSSTTHSRPRLGPRRR